MRRHRAEGFTLIELMIVIAIIAIIAAISLPNLLASKQSANQTAAVATLRNLVSCQAQISVTARIDADSDGKGEYGTLLEMSGGVGLRKGYSAGPPGTSDFSVKGLAMSPSVLSAVFSSITPTGYATKSGYAFIVYLPDAANPAGFVHEVGPAASASFSGPVGVDMAETVWCAYAQPVQYAGTGVARYFTNQKGDLLRSPNDVAKGAGITTSVIPNSAFRGTGITSPVAIGTTGNDGDVWTVAQ